MKRWIYKHRVGRHLLLAASLLILSNLSCTAQPSPDYVAHVTAYMDDLEEQGFSGGLFISVDAEPVLAVGYGSAHRGTDRPFTTQTVFPVGSVTKQFTAAAVMKLQMMDQLDVQDPISKYLDDVPAHKNFITIHHLLTHSSGLPDGLGYDFAEVGRDAFLEMAFNADLAFDPGTRYRYSNPGYSLLAAIVEKITGMTFDAFMRAELFEPAGMTSTGYDLGRIDPELLAHGYRGTDDWGTFADKPWMDDGPYWHLRGNGGILSTLEDMARWDRALAGDEILSEAVREQMFTPYVQEGPGAPSFYGYGWVVQETEDGLLYWHDGANPYFSSDFRRYADNNVSIFVTSNSHEFRAFDIMPDIANMVFGRPVERQAPRSDETEDDANEALTMEDIERGPPGRRARAVLDMLAGDEDDIRPFIDENLSPRLLEVNAMEDLVDGFRGDQQRIGPVTVGRIERPADDRIVLIVQSETGRWRELILDFAPEESWRIIGFGVESARDPSGE